STCFSRAISGAAASTLPRVDSRSCFIQAASRIFGQCPRRSFTTRHTPASGGTSRRSSSRGAATWAEEGEANIKNDKTSRTLRIVGERRGVSPTWSACRPNTSGLRLDACQSVIRHLQSVILPSSILHARFQGWQLADEIVHGPAGGVGHRLNAFGDSLPG